MKTGLNKIFILTLFIILIIECPVFAALESQIKQDVTIGEILKIGFTKSKVTTEAEFLQYKYPEGYELLLNHPATSIGSKTGEYITNLNENGEETVFLSLISNLSCKIKVEVEEKDGYGLFNGNTGRLKVYFYNAELQNGYQNTNAEAKFDVGYKIYSFPLLIYVLKEELEGIPSGRYVGTIKVTVNSNW